MEEWLRYWATEKYATGHPTGRFSANCNSFWVASKIVDFRFDPSQSFDLIPNSTVGITSWHIEKT
jgi:hypothetical protein